MKAVVPPPDDGYPGGNTAEGQSALLRLTRGTFKTAVNSELVVRDKNGDILTVRYEAVNAMLLNEFLKEHRKLQEQQATIAELRSIITQQEKDFAQH